MKRSLLFLILFTVILIPIYTNELNGKSYIGDFVFIDFYEDTLKYSGTDRTKGKEFEFTYPYKLVKEGKFIFIKTGENLKEKWLILLSDYLLLIYKKDNSYPFFDGINDFGRRLDFIYYDGEYFTTFSFLKEKNIEYRGSNLGKRKIPYPWVEGVDGYGIGEKIYIKKWAMKRLYFLNGYVSYDKPYLYEENSRVKKIRIYSEKNKNYKIIELEDTPNPQTIVLPEGIGDEIIIEILDVYKGTKWKDTCINIIAIQCMFFFGEKE